MSVSFNPQRAARRSLSSAKTKQAPSTPVMDVRSSQASAGVPPCRRRGWLWFAWTSTAARSAPPTRRAGLGCLLFGARFERSNPDELQYTTRELAAVNSELWDIEDELRKCEAGDFFGPRFVSLARSVYVCNDRRAAVKRRINDLLGAEIREEKAYALGSEECRDPAANFSFSKP